MKYTNIHTYNYLVTIYSYWDQNCDPINLRWRNTHPIKTTFRVCFRSPDFVNACWPSYCITLPQFRAAKLYKFPSRAAGETETLQCEHTPWKTTNMEPKVMEVWFRRCSISISWRFRFKMLIFHNVFVDFSAESMEVKTDTNAGFFHQLHNEDIGPLTKLPTSTIMDSNS